MSQGIPSFIRVPPDGSGKAVMNVQFSVPQADGTLQAVQAECVVIVDPVTGNAVRAMTTDQADTIIGLLRQLVENTK